MNIGYCQQGASDSRWVELPFKILVVGDYSRRPDQPWVGERDLFTVTRETFDQRLAERAPTLALTAPDVLSPDAGAEVSLRLRFKSLKDFAPDGLARQIPAMCELLALRSALGAIKGPLGPTAMFRKAIDPLLADEPGRQRLRHELGIGAPPPPVGASLFDELLHAFNMRPAQEGYDICKRGLEAVVGALLTPRFAGERLNKSAVDAIIGELDERLSAQLSPLLHHAEFQRLEAAWRALKFLVDRVDPRENIKVDVLDCGSEDLRRDFEDSPDLRTSGLYQVVRAATCGGAAGEPYGLVVADFEFGPAPRDVWLLSRCAAVAEATHAPFVAAAAPSMVGASSWRAAPDGEATASILASPTHAAWRAFRGRGEARFVGLCLPRFLLRLPYGYGATPVRAFNFEEDLAGGDGRYLWGNAAFAFATCVAESFARYRWCPNILGDRDGEVTDLPLHQVESGGEVRSRSPVEAALEDGVADALSSAGFIAMTQSRAQIAARFDRADSCHDPDGVDEETAADIGRRLAATLPHLFVVTRFAQYLGVLRRSIVANWPESAELQQQLDAWLQQFVAPSNAPAARGLGRWSLCEASLIVEAVREPAPGYRFRLSVRPRFRHAGEWFTLSLVGSLDA